MPRLALPSWSTSGSPAHLVGDPASHCGLTLSGHQLISADMDFRVFAHHLITKTEQMECLLDFSVPTCTKVHFPPIRFVCTYAESIECLIEVQSLSPTPSLSWISGLYICESAQVYRGGGTRLSKDDHTFLLLLEMAPTPTRLLGNVIICHTVRRKY